MSGATTTRAIVIGGGVGGLTAAIALWRAGIEATVFERAVDLQRIQVGGGIHLWHNAIRALRELGLDEQAEAVGSAVERQEFRNGRGTLLAAWPIGDISRRVGAPAIGVSRPDIHRVLVAALGEDAIRPGMECVGFTQDAAGVTARFADGREERADLLVGADGIGSAIRAQLHGAATPRYAGYAVWQAIVDYEHPSAPVGRFLVAYGPGSRFSYYHVGGERLYWFAVANAPARQRDPDGGPKEALLARFAGWAEPATAVIAATDGAAITRQDMIDRKPIKRWGEGRVTLLGDAAHPMTFNVGQGACQAIEDAVVLARCLGGGADVPAALRDYEARRIKRTTPYVTLAWRIGAMARWENPVACAARDQIMRLLFNGPALKEHERSAAFAF